MKKLLLLLTVLLTTVAFTQTEKEQYHRAKISYNTAEDLQRLAQLDVPVDHGVHKRGYYLISDFSASEVARAQAHGFRVDILIEDATAYYQQQNRTAAALNPTCENPGTNYETPANFNLGSMGGYLTYQELLDELDQMRALYPNLITAKSAISNFQTNGQPDNSTTPSIGGNAIQWVKISDNPESSAEGEPQILYDAIHHAREPASLSQLVFYMWYLLENYGTDPEVTSIVDNTELYFVPVINPDGYLYNELIEPNGGGLWRKNRFNGHGVDNNRNYDYHIDGDPNNGIWGGPGSSSDVNSQIYHGSGPFSEVENQAMKWFVENHNFVMALNNHTSGQLLYYPFGYANVATPDDALYQAMGAELTSRNGYFPLRDSPFAGDSDDFMYGTVGTHDKIFAFTPEIGTSFWPPSSQIVSICQNMMFLNLTAAKMTNNSANVTDNTPIYIGDSQTASAEFDLRNLGISGQGNFTVRLNPISTNIASPGNVVTFTNMDPLTSDSGTIQYVLAGGTQSGDDVVYELVVNNGSYDSAIRVNRKFGGLSAVFEDDASNTNNFDNNGWGITNATFVSAPSSITDSPTGNYPNNTNETIALSDPIDLTNAEGANVTFFARWDIENNFDYVQFEVSINGGSTWEPQCGKFTNLGSSNGSQPTNQPLYDGTQNSWVQEEIDLSDYLGESILVRFQLVSDGGQRADGFYFDDLVINTLDSTVLSVNDLESNSNFVVYPNPVFEKLNIATQLSQYTVAVYNLQGQRVIETSERSGNSEIDYTRLAPGVYLMQIQSEAGIETLKIVKR